MNILQIVPTISIQASGPSYTVSRLCEQLIEQGAGVELCSLKWVQKNEVHAYNREFPFIKPLRRLGVSPGMRRHVVHGTQSYEVVHVHGMWQMPGVYGASAAMRRGIPLVWSPRGSLSRVALATGTRWKPVFWRLFQRRALERVRMFHATSAVETEDIRAMGFGAAIATIPNGIDIPVVRRDLSSGRRTLLYLGRIHPIKGLPMLLEAWRQLAISHPDWDLRIVGQGEPHHVRELQQLIASLGLSRVHLPGAAFGEDKWRQYAAADLFVLPTRSENFGIVVAESLACGTPVVTTRGAPWAGVVKERCGWWCDVGSVPLHHSLAEAMRTPRDTLEAMGENGRRWMQRDYSWSMVASMLQESYSWICGNVQRPAWIS
jgi:glycosyltransferase involved in cell wall biosynthesis